MKIVILCEGRTEVAFRESLLRFLEQRIAGPKPKLQFDRHDGALPTRDKLKRVVRRLHAGKDPASAVVALTDVYPAFRDAEDAKSQMRQWVGDEPRFYPHAAQYDFEAWLLPYWDRITELAKRQAKPFGQNPEHVNGNDPPAHRLAALFEAGKSRDSYRKPRDAKRILGDADLSVAITACPQLKSFVNAILTLLDPLQAIP